MSFERWAGLKHEVFVSLHSKLTWLDLYRSVSYVKFDCTLCLQRDIVLFGQTTAGGTLCPFLYKQNSLKGN